MPDFSRDTDIGHPDTDEQNFSTQSNAQRDESIENFEQNVFAPEIVEIAVSKNLVASGSAHHAGDMMNDATSTAWVIRNAAREPGGSGYITKVQAITEVEAQSHMIALLIFNKTPSVTMVDNAACASPTNADEASFEDEILMPALHARGDGSYSVATPSTVGNVPLAFTCAPNSRDLFFIPVCVQATTHTATEKLTFKFKIERFKTAGN